MKKGWGPKAHIETRGAAAQVSPRLADGRRVVSPSPHASPGEAGPHPDQLTLDQLHRCPVCNGTGKRRDPETGQQTTCRGCEGTGNVNYDPAATDIPY